MGITTHGTVETPVAGDERRPVDIPALTGLRAFAAAVVVVHHLRGLTTAFVDYPVIPALRPLLDAGALGVDVFFVLSGFVIAHTYAHRLAAPAPGATRSYLVARLARVYPLHLVTLLAFAAVIVVGGVPAADPEGAAHYSVLAFLGNLFMLQALPGVYPWNFPAWSISCELAAYVLFPLFAARLLRARWTTALVLAAVALGLQLLVLGQVTPTDLATHTAFWARIAGEFTAGALLWVVWQRRLRPGPWGDVAVLACLAGALWLLWHGHFLLTMPLLAALVPTAACATGPVRTLLAHPVTQWGGRISYALYLVHLVMMMFVVWAMPGARMPDSAPWATVYFVAVVLASVAAAALLHHGVEEPARRWLRRRFAEPAATAPEVPPAPEEAGAARGDG